MGKVEDEVKRLLGEVTARAASTDPAKYITASRGVLMLAAREFGVETTLRVQTVVIDAYRLRETPEAQRRKIEDGLNGITFERTRKEDGYDPAALVDAIIKWAPDFLTGITEEPVWGKIPQGRIINDIERPNEFLPLVETDRMTGEASLKHNSLILKAADAALLSSLDTPTFQFLDFLLLKAHRIGNFSQFTVSVTEYMKARGLKDRKAAKAQIKKACNNLYGVSMRYDGSKLTKKEIAKLPKGFPLKVDFRILDAKAEINNRGDIGVSFGKLFSPYIASVPPMEYHRSLLRLNSHMFPYAHAIGRKLLEMFNMRIDSCMDEIASGRYEVRPSVETLLNVTGLPDEETVRGRYNRDFMGKVIRPFERDLSAALSEMGKWEYCRARGEPLKEGDDPRQYDTFVKLFVRVTFDDYPSQVKRIGGRKS